MDITLFLECIFPQRGMFTVRYFYLILYFCVFQTYATAQNRYKTIPDFETGSVQFKKYSVLTFGEKKDENIVDSGELYLDGFVEDTVINGKTYKVFQELYYSVESILYKSYYFRQEGDRVYRYYDDIGEEIVVYDFGLSRGDIITKKGQMRMRVVDVGKAGDYPEYAGTGDKERRMIKLEGTNNTSTHDIWIEGLGSVYTGLLDKEDYDAEEAVVEYMYCRNHITEEQEAPVMFNLSKNQVKTIAGKGDVLTDADCQDYQAFLAEPSPFLMEFIDDTLHVRGFAELNNPVYMARAWISDNTVNLGIIDVADFRYNQAINGDVFRIDTKIPGFTPGAYTINCYGRPISDIQTVVCGDQKVCGDVNQDYNVDISDIVAVINVIAGSAANPSADVNTDGKTDISDIVAVINIIAENRRDPAVEEGLCPDEHHPHAVDLGIGVCFACCNIGARAPWEYGGFYAWGETVEKDNYIWENYEYRESPRTCKDIGQDISGSDYDVALVLWGKGWQLPTTGQIKQLIDNCTYEWTTLNGVQGRKYTGAYGKSIFLPAAGRKGYEWVDCERQGYYWLSSMVTDSMPNTDNDKMRQAHSLMFNRSQWTYNLFDYREFGLNVRPVME